MIKSYLRKGIVEVRKNKITKAHIILCVTAYFQILFVSCNVVFIQNKSVAGIIISSFFISLLWTLNVKRVAFGGWLDRFLYAISASCGAFMGYYFSNWLFDVFK